jgi:hypothetical protein
MAMDQFLFNSMVPLKFHLPFGVCLAVACVAADKFVKIPAVCICSISWFRIGTYLVMYCTYRRVTIDISGSYFVMVLHLAFQEC